MNTTVFNKKNKLLIPIIIILLIPTALAVYFSLNPGSEADIPMNFSEIKVEYEDFVNVTVTDKKAFELYEKAVLGADKVTDEHGDLSSVTPFTVTFTLGDSDEPMVYDFYLKYDPEECFYVNPDGEYYLFDKDDALKLLARDEFQAINKTATCPYAVAGITQTQLAPTSGEWHHADAEGEFKVEEIDGSGINTLPVKINVNDLGTLAFLSSTNPDSVNVKLSLAGAVKHDGPYENMLNADIMAQNDTYYDMVITAEWQEKEGVDYYGKLEYVVQLFYDVSPSYEIVGSSGITRGDFGVVNITNFNDGEKLYVTSEFPFPTELQVFKTPDGQSFAFLPVELWTAGATGSYDITFSTSDGASSTKKVQIRDSASLAPASAVKTQDMLITDIELSGHFSEESFAEFYNVVAEKTAATETKQLWNGKFAYPNADNKKNRGNGMADCGTLRTVNASGMYTNSYYHNGVDLAMADGESVLASNSGKVVFAGELMLTGNTVIIDHGCSILSYYGHLGSISVSVGDTVNTSSVLGTAGKTGFAVAANGATGSAATQVHFAISMEGKFVVPRFLNEYGVIF